ncbi:MAG: DUF2203 family protein [Pseudomonadota bacterium]|nr:DUF2203 family protein [Pseudomonadota bacterium]
MSQKKQSKFPTNNKKYSIEETNGYIPLLEKSFIRLKQLNESVNNILHDLGIDSSDLKELDLLKSNEHTSNEEMYIKLTDLKLYLSAIQSTIRDLTLTGCLIDNLDKGHVVWPADHEASNIEISWVFGDKQCKLVTPATTIPNDIYLVPDQEPTTSMLNED